MLSRVERLQSALIFPSGVTFHGLNVSIFYYYFHLFQQYKPVDAAYPASDEALRLIMQKPQCTRLSVTNGDNAYGSEVVANILSPAAAKADLILLPLDTRYFAAEGIICVFLMLTFDASPLYYTLNKL